MEGPELFSKGEKSSSQISLPSLEDPKNNLKSRRMQIFFKNRFISIGNNVEMKDKINDFISRQHNK